MSHGGRNPPFSRAIPYVVVGICPLPKVVIFGSFGESRNGLIWGPEMIPFGDRRLIQLGTAHEFMLGPKMNPE